MTNATNNRTGGGGFGHFTIKEPLKGGMNTSPEPYAEGDVSKEAPQEEACTAPHTKGAAISLGMAAPFGGSTYDKNGSIEPYANESRRMP